jgi:hypothetical protein
MAVSLASTRSRGLRRAAFSYRLLAQRGESRARRDQLTHPPYQKPELLAWTAPLK